VKTAPVGNIPMGYTEVPDSQSAVVRKQKNLKFDNRGTSYINEIILLIFESTQDDPVRKNVCCFICITAKI
jgi:hypothetical protein